MVPNTSPAKKICSVEECGKKVWRRTLCSKHYDRLLKHGDVHTVLGNRANADIRFLERIDKTGSCWNWTGYKNSEGYGKIMISGKSKFAHRVSYEKSKGKIEAGLLVDHLCHNASCVNPDHLRKVTPKQNIENHSGPTSRNKTGVRGVHMVGKKYCAQVQSRGKNYNAGRFDSLEEAEIAVTKLRNKLFTHNNLDRN